MIGNGSGHQSDSASSAPASRPNTAAKGPDQGYGPPHPLDGILKQLRELIEYANFYVETRKDVLRATLRSLIWKAALGVIAAVAGVTIIVVAAVYAMSGIAEALGLLFDERLAFLGYLITGFAVLLGIAATAYFGIKSLTKSARRRTIEKYERRQQQQRERFGRSVGNRARQLRPSQRS